MSFQFVDVLLLDVPKYADSYDTDLQSLDRFLLAFSQSTDWLYKG